MRKAMVVIAGVVLAGIVIAGIEAAGHASLRGFNVFAGAIVGYALGAFAGTWLIATFTDRKTSFTAPVVLGALAAFNLAAFPHPLWFAPSAFVALAAGWWAGARSASAFNHRGPPDQRK